MNIIEKLSQKPEIPEYAKILSDFPVVSVADHLEITSTYVSAILGGSRRPGKALEKKFVALANEVKAEIASCS